MLGAMKARALFTSLFIIVVSSFWSALAILLFPLSPRGGLFLLFARMWARTLFYVGGIRLQTRICPQLDPRARYVYLSSHESLTDILALFAALPQPVVMVAKRSLLILPIFSWGMWLAGFVFINRKDRAGAYKSIQKAGARVRRGRSVVVFPEGTRTDDGELQRFKRGGFVLSQSAGVPVIPVAIYGTRKILPKNHFRVYPGDIAVFAGAPMIPPPAGEPLEPFIEQVRDEVGRLRAQARDLIEGTGHADAERHAA